MIKTYEHLNILINILGENNMKVQVEFEFEESEYEKTDKLVLEQAQEALVNRLASKFEAENKSKLFSMLDATVSEKMQDVVGDLLQRKIANSYNWDGTPVGETKLLVDIAKEKIDRYLEEKVDRDGKITKDNYYAQTRLVWALEKAIDNKLRNEMDTACKTVVAEFRKSLTSEMVSKLKEGIVNSLASVGIKV